MAINKSELFKAINMLPQKEVFDFLTKSNHNTFSLLSTNKDTGIIFNRFNGAETQRVSVTMRNLEKLSSKIRPYVPFSIDVVVGASGNWRSLFESALALSKHFFIYHVNRQRRLIYAPQHEHEVGIFETLTNARYAEFSKLALLNDYKYFIEKCYPFEDCYQLFINTNARMSRFFREVDSENTSIFDFDSVSELEAVYNQLQESHLDLLSQNTSDDRFTYGDVLKSYLLFLRAKENYSFY